MRARIRFIRTAAVLLATVLPAPGGARNRPTPGAARRHPNFSVPTAPNINSAGFGAITGTVGNARQIQFNDRINF